MLCMYHAQPLGCSLQDPPWWNQGFCRFCPQKWVISSQQNWQEEMVQAPVWTTSTPYSTRTRAHWASLVDPDENRGSQEADARWWPRISSTASDYIEDYHRQKLHVLGHMSLIPRFLTTNLCSLGFFLSRMCFCSRCFTSFSKQILSPARNIGTIGTDKHLWNRLIISGGFPIRPPIFTIYFGVQKSAATSVLIQSHVPPGSSDGSLGCSPWHRNAGITKWMGQQPPRCLDIFGISPLLHGLYTPLTKWGPHVRRWRSLYPEAWGDIPKVLFGDPWTVAM